MNECATKPSRPKDWWLAGAGALGSILAGWLALHPDVGGPLERLSFDWPFAFRSDEARAGIAVVLMDDASYTHFGEKPTEPWDRSRHAQLLRQPCMTNARLVVLDVVLDVAGTNYWGTNGQAKDADLAAALREHGRVLLAAARPRSKGASLLIQSGLPPIECFANHAQWADADFPDQGSGTIRRHCAREGLAWKAAQIAGFSPDPPAPNRWINYYVSRSPARMTVSYRDVFDPERVPPDAFTNTVVFVGMGGPFLGFGGPVAGDTHPTPFTRWSRGGMPGVEIQATAFLNLVHRDWLIQIPALAETALAVMVGVLFGGGLCFLRPLTGATLAVLGMIALPLADLWLVAEHHYWFPWAAPALVQIPLALGWSGLLQTRRLIRRTEELTEALAAADAASSLPSAELPTQPVPAAPARSTVVIADHTLLRKVGAGAYGEVWLARSLVGMYRAVKIVRRANFADEAPYDREFCGIEKFMPVSLKHPGLLQVLHVGQDPPERYFFYIMEAADDEVSGQRIDPERYSPRNLHSELLRRQRLPLVDCVELGLSLSGALAYLHDRQLIHRDLKPSNIVFVHGRPKIADVGLVTDIRGVRTSVTALGTPGYMAPEGPGTKSADVFSLGKVLYEAFTGLAPNRFPEIPSEMLVHAGQESLIRLNRLLLKACENNPLQRYQTAGEFREDLLTLDGSSSGAGRNVSGETPR